MSERPLAPKSSVSWQPRKPASSAGPLWSGGRIFAGVAGGHRAPQGAEQDRDRRHTLRLDFDGARQPMLERNRRRLRRIETEVDTKLTVSRFAGDTLDDGADVAVLRPRETIEAKARRLSEAHTPERRCGKLGNDFHVPVRDNGRD